MPPDNPGSLNARAMLRAWCLLALLLCASAALLPHTASADNLGLVGYWSFNEGTGIRAGDASGQWEDGALTGTPAGGNSWVDGKRGKTLTFDGNADYVKIANPIMPSGGFHLRSMGEAWGWVFRLHEHHQQPGANDDQFEFNIVNGKIDVWLIDGRGTFIGTVATSTWSHVVVRRSGLTIEAFINGVQDPGGDSDGRMLRFCGVPNLHRTRPRLRPIR